MENGKWKNRYEYVLLESSLFLLLLFLSFSFPVSHVVGEYGENATISSLLEVGKSAPNIISLTIEDPITLVPNSTKTINCSAIVEDYDTEIDVVNASAEFFHSTSFYGDSDDNNTHYTNESCIIDASYGGVYDVFVYCGFKIQYYANKGTWNCTMEVNDNSSYSDTKTNDTQINPLLAINLPPTINYGLVNATYVSKENITRVANFGNVPLNLTLSGYGYAENDNLAMNCTLGSNKNISVHYEKFNLTSTSPIDQSDFSEFDLKYVNLSSSPEVYEFDLDYNFDETTNGAYNDTYWRIYVPEGVAGSCSGNIIFGATQAGSG